MGCILSLVPKDEVSGLSRSQLADAAAAAGVRVVYHPIRDFDGDDLAAQLPGAAARLARAARAQRAEARHMLARAREREDAQSAHAHNNGDADAEAEASDAEIEASDADLLEASDADLLEADARPNVLCMCTHAVGRAPAVAVAYLHWYCGTDLGAAAAAVAAAHGRLAPAEGAIARAGAALLDGRAELCGMCEATVSLPASPAFDPGAEVCVAGEFTGWRPVRMRARTRRSASSTGGPADVVHEASFRLPRGAYEYKFLLDGVWVCDASGAGDDTHCNWEGHTNHVLRVPQAAAHAGRDRAGDRGGHRLGGAQVGVEEDGEGGEGGRGRDGSGAAPEQAALRLAAARMAFAVDPCSLGPKMPRVQ